MSQMQTALLAKVAFLAALPVTELRFALPYGMHAGLTGEAAFAAAVLGNIVATTVAILLLPPVVRVVEQHWGFAHRLLTKIFAHTRTKHGKNFEKLGALALIVLVAIPLPGSGGYTGALVAYLFGVSRRASILLIGTGLIASGLLVWALTTGVLAIAGW